MDDWFTEYDVAGYDIVLGKRWLRSINGRHTTDYVENSMEIWDDEESKDAGKAPHSLVGLRT